MKSKIFAKLKQEYSALGLGDEVLMSRAESLAALGLVTDENIDAVVFAQRSDLEGLQKRTDKRVTDALEKERKKHEEETRKKIEEALEKQKAEGGEDGTPQPPKGGENDDPRFSALNKQIAELIEASRKRQEEYAASIKTLTDANSSLETKVKSLTEENNLAKVEKEKAARLAKIKDKAKELGVPDWRIEEGFNIAEDATDESIAETLTKVANNINTNLLPGSKAFRPMGDNEPSKEEIANLAASIVK